MRNKEFNLFGLFKPVSLFLVLLLAIFQWGASEVFAASYPTSTTVSSSSTTVTSGTPVTFTATITFSKGGNLKGSVQFYDGATALGSPVTPTTVKANTSATATLTTSALSIGTHSITAKYSGDSNNDPSTSAAIGETINRITTTTTLSGPTTATAGSSITFTANVSTSSGTPSGSVTFYDGPTSIGTGTLSNGSATFSTSTLSAGSHSITAVYNGDTTHLTSVSNAVSLTIKITTTTTLSGPTTATAGSSIAFTANVSTSSGTPTGSVTFYDGPTSIGTGTLSNGSAPFSTSTLSAGSHSITAVYAGDSTYLTSTSNAVYLTITRNTTTITLSGPTTATAGSSVTFTANVSTSSGTPTGSVTFYDGPTSIGTGILSNGSATLSTSSLSAGSHSITAVYNGDSSHLSSSVSSPVSITVSSLITTTTTLSSSGTYVKPGVSITLTANVSLTDSTGTVTFNDGSTALGTGTVVNGVATFSISSLAVGTHNITAVYGGDSTHTGSTSSSVSVTVDGKAPVTKYHLTNITATSSTGKTYISGFTIALQATDDLSGVKMTQYKILNSNNTWSLLTTYTAPFNVYAANTLEVQYFSTDNAGNVETPANDMNFVTGVFTGAGSY